MSYYSVIEDYLLENPIDRTQQNPYDLTALHLGVSKEAVRQAWRKLRRKGLVEKEHAYNKVIVDTTKEYREERREDGSVRIQDTVDRKLTDKELFERYGRNQKEWKIISVWFKDNSNGFLLSVHFAPIKQGIQTLDYQKQFKDFVEGVHIKDKVEVVLDPSVDGVTVVLNIADLHIGKLVNEEEIGEKYNIKIAKQRFLNCVANIADRASKIYTIKKFILSTLGDTLHIDNLKSTTTSGTYVEADTRASKVFSTALEIITEGIEILKNYSDEVEFININGNHCELSEQHLGIALEAFYRNDVRVSVDSTPKNRKYRLVGENLLGWTHGDTKMDNLPLTMAIEQPKYWGKSLWRIMQCGHLHTSKKRVYQSENEFNGVVVRHFSSISGTDNWHDKNTYVGNSKKATGLIFKEGIVGILDEVNHTL